jgi:putative sigma-54 modulation protein
MIKNIDITGVRYALDETTKKYVMAKIGRLDRYVSRHARKSIRAEVRLKEVNREYGNKYECDVVIHVPGQSIAATDSTLNMLAAVDIVEAKLRTQLRKYKESHTEHAGRHNLIGRIKRSFRRGDSARGIEPTLDSEPAI